MAQAWMESPIKESPMTKETPFETWWREEGSQPRSPLDDWEEHTKRRCWIAWANGQYKANEEWIKHCRDKANSQDDATRKLFTKTLLEMQLRGEA